ncbi:putative mitochondrial protein [Trifolium repens]|nr:putative mitochondrial protein [Trifolium repens]
MKGQQESTDEQALKASSNGGRESARGRGRNSSSRGRGRGRQNKDFVECFKCHKLGHYQNDCPDWEGNANYAEFDDDEEMLLMAHNDQAISGKNHLWFLDSGCSNHMIGEKEWFFDFDSSYKDSVKLGDDSRMSVMGKGSVKLHINNIVYVISDVYYVPGLKTNLLSIGQLQQKQVTVIFKNDVCKVFHDEKGLLFTTLMSKNRMYVVSAPMITPMCLKTTKQEATLLWHNRYAHLSYRGLSTLSKKQMVKGLPELAETEENCVNCLTGKQSRDSIPKQAKWRASTKLELVHSDICGPINPQSNGGNRYFITFTDDYSRKTWIYLLKEKSNAFEIFKNFKALVEKESGNSIQCLRTDRGGEYLSNSFNEFCSKEGIKRQLTAAYTPQQNGVSERKNRTLLNMVRSMINEKKVPKQFWPEAVKWATYMMNRSPTLNVKNMTPEEAWSGVKPSVHYFRVFGCIAHVHIHDSQRKKLDNKSKRCVLLGVSEESKVYKLYDPVDKKIIISRDVVFEESKSWEWGKSQNKSNKVNQNGLADELSDTEEMINDAAELLDTKEINNDAAELLDNDDTTIVDNTTSESEEEETPVRQTRIRKTPAKFNDYVTGRAAEEEIDLHNLAVYNNSQDPSTYEEAMKMKVWREAMKAEIEALQKNDTWELTVLPAGCKSIGVKWVYKTKYNEKGDIDKYKARLVAKGYTQRHGIDFNEVFAPVARWDTIRSILALAANNRWNVFQLDVKSAFLHGELAEDIYVNQPAGYSNGDKCMVYKLKKALYGLKQAPRAWYSKIETYFASETFMKCPHEHTLFVKYGDKSGVLIVSLYVDDLIYTGNDQGLIENFKSSMKRKFAMTDLGKMRYFLGMEVNQSSEGIYMHQCKYATEILSRFGMENCNKVCSPIVPGCRLSKNENGKATDASEYKQMMGCLMYLLASRPDLAFSVCLVARYMDRPTEIHVAAVKRIMRYLKGTLSYGMLYKADDNKNLCLIGWSDSDYAGDLDDRKSTTGYLYMLGSGAISWSSKKQPIVTLSTTEAEFVAAASCACQGIWLRNVLDFLKQKQQGCTIIYCDNSSSIKLSKNPVMHGRCKHINVRFHFLRNLTKDGVIELVHCKTDEQLADLFTKPLKLESFCKLREGLGMVDCNNRIA